MISKNNEIHIHTRSYSSNETFLISKMNSSRFSHRSYSSRPTPTPRINPASISRNQIKVWLFCEGTYRNFLAKLFSERNHRLPKTNGSLILNDRSTDREKKNGDNFDHVFHVLRLEHLNLLLPTKKFLLTSVKADSSISKQGFNFNSILFSAQPVSKIPCFNKASLYHEGREGRKIAKERGKSVSDRWAAMLIE